MSHASPLVSVIIRSMDRQTLDRTLASVAAQDYPCLEAVVVAACGPHHRDLPGRVGRVPVRLVRSDSPLSRPHAANAGLDAARGDLLNLLDDDDDWLPQHAGTLVRALAGAPDVGLAYSQSLLLDANEQPIAVFGNPFDPMTLFYNSLFDAPAAMFRRSVVRAGARFDTQFHTLEDLDFWLQCMQRTRFLRVPKVTCRVRPALGTSGTSGVSGESNRDPLQMSTDGARFESKWCETEQRVAETPAGLLSRAQRFLKAGDQVRARPLLERAHALLPDDVNALNLLAMARHYDGDSESGLPLIERALQLVPGHAGLLRNRELLANSLAR